MAGLYPHWPEQVDGLILNLPVGHWFFHTYDRFLRTPQPDEIVAAEPPADLIRLNEQEIQDLIAAEVREAGVEDRRVEGRDVGGPARDINHAIVVDRVSRHAERHAFSSDGNHECQAEGYNLVAPIPQRLPPPPVVQPIIDADIIIPHNGIEAASLIRNFRNEILKDWIEDMLLYHGFGQFRMVGREINYAEIAAIIRQWAMRHRTPYVEPFNVKKHQWLAANGEYDCIYYIHVDNMVYHGTAEELEGELCGLRYALWCYWKDRTRVQQRTIVRYMVNQGYNGWYREIMWHYLPLADFLRLWRQRRASRRG